MVRLLPLLALGCATTPDVPPPPRAGRLVLLHTNDMHAHYLPTEAQWMEGRPAIGGMVDLDRYLRTARQEAGDAGVLVLDGGDILSGTPLSEIEVEGVRGGAMLSFLEALDYDAWTLGNHEFDQGLSNATALVAASPVPVVSANLRDASGGPAFPGLQPAVVLERGGLRVGVVGVMTEEFHGLAGADVRAAVQVLPVVDAVRAEVARLDPETDLLVVLSHAGVDMDRRLAAEVPGLDLVVGAHTHTAIKSPERVGDAWVVQAGSYARSVGRLELDVSGDRIASLTGGLVDLVPSAEWLPADPELVAVVERWSGQIDAVYGRVVGAAEVPLYRKEGPAFLGDWITDVLQQATGADLGLFNTGGLRADLPAGTLTLRHLYEVFPFSNRVAVVTARGTVLEEIARASLDDRIGGRAGIPVAGVTFDWRPGPDGAPQLVAVRVGDRPFDPQATYRIATNDFLADHWEERYPGTLVEVKLLPETVLDAALAAVAAGPVTAPAARIRKVE